MTDTACPLCNGPTEEHEAYRDRACPACGLCAPPDVLERIAGLMAYAADNKPAEQRIAALEAEVAHLKQRWRHYMDVHCALGIVYEADGVDTEPGPVERLVEEVRQLQSGREELGRLQRGGSDRQRELADATRVWRMNCECACSACQILDDVLPDREPHGGRHG